MALSNHPSCTVNCSADQKADRQKVLVTRSDLLVKNIIGPSEVTLGKLAEYTVSEYTIEDITDDEKAQIKW